MDDPSKPEFAAWNSYPKFADRVREDRRFATDKESRAFIATVLATVPTSDRDMTISVGQPLFRAQKGCDTEPIFENSKVIGARFVGHPAGRMKPIQGQATEGRANPAGIAFLYLSSAIKTAISEVRPWVGSYVSVAEVRATREMRIVNLTKGHGEWAMGFLTLDQISGADPVDAETKRRAVWTDIDNAFSRPVSRSENALDYVPTQILAEAFRNHGYDGIVYRSVFGNPEYNICLFDLGAAQIGQRFAYRVTRLDVDYEEA